MEIFRPEVERLIKMLTMGAAIGAFLLPLQWGYQQHREAQTWREAACSYRLRDVAHGISVVPDARRPEDPCTTLRRLGMDVDASQTSLGTAGRR